MLTFIAPTLRMIITSVLPRSWLRAQRSEHGAEGGEAGRRGRPRKTEGRFDIGQPYDFYLLARELRYHRQKLNETAEEARAKGKLKAEVAARSEIARKIDFARDSLVHLKEIGTDGDPDDPGLDDWRAFVTQADQAEELTGGDDPRPRFPPMGCDQSEERGAHDPNADFPRPRDWARA